MQMGDESEAKPSRLPTIGHHFGSLQQCTQKAWLEYHGDRKLRAPPPGFLSKLQREGIEHERKICETYYPNAIRIPEADSPESRTEQTIAAMKSGTHAILQPYFMGKHGRGIADVIEHVRHSEASDTGHIYRIGEFKRATSLSTSHVLQVAWYDELLSGIQHETCNDAFFVLGNMQRRNVALSDIRESFQLCKHNLWQLRDTSQSPGPHLCKWCVSCQWRDVCLPQLRDSDHVSLLPGVSRSISQNLSDAGIASWQQVTSLDNVSLKALGFDSKDLPLLRQASDRLTRGEAVLRYSIKTQKIRQLTAISLEFVPDTLTPDGYPVPLTAWIESPSGPVRIPLAPSESGWPHALDAVFDTQGLAFYGATQTVTFLRMVQNAGKQHVKCVDLLDIVEKLVHAPIRGLELQTVMLAADSKAVSADSTAKRVLGIRSIINWLAGTEGLAV